MQKSSLHATSELPPQEALLSVYESLLERSSRMLTQAREEDWEALIEEESQYVIDIERVSRLEGQEALNGEQQARKESLLEQILEQDMEIRRRLLNRRDELGELIGTARRQRDLHRAYRSADRR
ncbi:flagellar protein FliT [Aidingimonas lacisalsi]|uniref:flagellar protein FliT n=1 Tax=Aidingimonas lacisalsi TaxID=2604086 RepID=UPI0011D24BF6|nr:flagellar protein FliT [Aidingimonas lacisalsi]